jgi:ABC-type transport system involved in cytochrome c biogenesis permease subunit
MHDHPLNQQTLSPDEMEHLARVASRLPPERPVSLTPTHYGQSAMWIGVVLTLATMLALALQANGRPTFGLAESFLLTLFVVLVLWLSVWRHSLR